MRSYTFNVRDATSGAKLSCGMLHAETIEDAARKAIRVCKLTIKRRIRTTPFTWDDTDFILNGRKVYLAIGIPPEYYLDATQVDEEQI